MREKRLVAFRYREHDRLVEPHILGRTVRGKVVLSGYQVAGTTEEGPLGWRNFALREIERFTVTERSFEDARADYNPHDPTFAQIRARLDRRNGRRFA